MQAVDKDDGPRRHRTLIYEPIGYTCIAMKPMKPMKPTDAIVLEDLFQTPVGEIDHDDAVDVIVAAQRVTFEDVCDLRNQFQDIRDNYKELGGFAFAAELTRTFETLERQANPLENTDFEASWDDYRTQRKLRRTILSASVLGNLSKSLDHLTVFSVVSQLFARAMKKADANEKAQHAIYTIIEDATDAMTTVTRLRMHVDTLENAVLLSQSAIITGLTGVLGTSQEKIVELLSQPKFRIAWNGIQETLGCGSTPQPSPAEARRSLSQILSVRSASEAGYKDACSKTDDLMKELLKAKVDTEKLQEMTVLQACNIETRDKIQTGAKASGS